MNYVLYYDTVNKTNYLTLGYFGGGAVSFADFKDVANRFANSLGCSINKIKIDEILHSRRYKGFKFIYADIDNQKPINGAKEMENVYAWLTN